MMPPLYTLREVFTFMFEPSALTGFEPDNDNVEVVLCNPDETPPETPPKVPETPETFTETFETFETFASPVSKSALAEQYGVSRTSVNNWLSRVADILSSLGITDPIVDAGNMVTPFGLRQLADFRKLGAVEFREHLYRSQTGRCSPGSTTTETALAIATTDWDFDPDIIPTEIVDVTPRQTESLLQVSELTNLTEELNGILANSREVAAKILQRDRLVRRANMIALARKHATEDKATYAATYQNELAKDGLGI